MSNEDLRELFEDRIKSHTMVMESQFSSIKTVLESIDSQVKKTNGRVTRLEETVISLQLADANHYKSCPQIARIKEVEEAVTAYKSKMDQDLQEYNFFKKYPKVSVGIVAFAVLTMLFSYIGFTTLLNSSHSNGVGINKNTTEIDKSQDQMTETEKSLQIQIKELQDANKK